MIYCLGMGGRGRSVPEGLVQSLAALGGLANSSE